MNPEIHKYNEMQEAGCKEVCELLAQEIDCHLPGAESKVWHSHPVWFLDGNPRKLQGNWEIGKLGSEIGVRSCLLPQASDRRGFFCIHSRARVMRRSVQTTSKSMRRLAVLSSARSTRQGACSPRAAVNRASLLRLMRAPGDNRSQEVAKPAVSACITPSPRTVADGQVPCNSALSRWIAAQAPSQACF